MPLRSEFSQQLETGLSQLGLTYEQAQVDRLLAYLQLLSKWNKVYNLTAIRDVNRMISHHLLDSLAILPALHGERVVDVGAGAGLPGIPLAIMRRDCYFVELESNHKKARFMRQVLMELAIKNTTVVCQRAEDYRGSKLASPGFDTVLSRAFASLPEMLRVAGPLCTRQGIILAMKGKIPKSELNSLPEGYICDKVESLCITGLEAERHLVHIKPHSEGAATVSSEQCSIN
ncbi:MAG: 16S rRNA (guanine(527)-N(7))-methyltransferase RsmG [Thiohalomonadales bacterium]